MLTKTAAKLEVLSWKQKESAQLYSDAIRELQKQIEGKEELKRGFDEKIQRLNTDIQALRTATRRFEGNGYTALFDIVDRVNKQSSKQAIEEAEKEMIAQITYARLLAPLEPFSNLMQLEGQGMWIERLIRLCLFTDLSEMHVENKDRFWGCPR